MYSYDHNLRNMSICRILFAILDCATASATDSAIENNSCKLNMMIEDITDISQEAPKPWLSNTTSRPAVNAAEAQTENPANEIPTTNLEPDITDLQELQRPVPFQSRNQPVVTTETYQWDVTCNEELQEKLYHEESNTSADETGASSRMTYIYLGDYIRRMWTAIVNKNKMWTAIVSTKRVLRTMLSEFELNKHWAYDCRGEDVQQKYTDDSTTLNHLVKHEKKLFENFMGCRSLVQTLLLIAGIESNPGPGPNQPGRNTSPEQTPGHDVSTGTLDSGFSTGIGLSTSIQIRDPQSGSPMQSEDPIAFVNTMQAEHMYGPSKQLLDDFRVKSFCQRTELLLINIFGEVNNSGSLLMANMPKMLSENSCMVDITSHAETADDEMKNLVAHVCEIAQYKFRREVFLIKKSTIDTERPLSLVELTACIMKGLQIDESTTSSANVLQMKKYIENQLKTSKDVLLILEGFQNYKEIPSYLQKVIQGEEMPHAKVFVVSRPWGTNKVPEKMMRVSITVVGDVRAAARSEAERNTNLDNIRNVIINVLVNVISQPTFTKHDFREKVYANQSKVDLATLRNNEGFGLLHLVVLYGSPSKVDLMEVLFDIGLWEEMSKQIIDGSSSNQHNGLTALQLAEKLSKQKAKAFIEKLNKWEREMTVLQIAARSGDVATVDELLASCPYLTKVKTGKEATALYWACTAGSLEIVRKLVSAGENPREKTTKKKKVPTATLR